MTHGQTRLSSCCELEDDRMRSLQHTYEYDCHNGAYQVDDLHQALKFTEHGELGFNVFIHDVLLLLYAIGTELFRPGVYPTNPRCLAVDYIATASTAAIMPKYANTAAIMTHTKTPTHESVMSRSRMRTICRSFEEMAGV